MKKLSMEELNRMTVEDFKESHKINLSILLDDIRSMANVGSIFRTADCFRIKKIYLCGITSQPPHREIEKTALGATESVAWEYCEDALEVVTKLKNENYQIISLEQASTSQMLSDFQAASKEALLILGNEVFGVNENLLKLSDSIVEIPQFGTKHSFNVSVSCGIFLWDYFMKTTGKVLV